jgi:tetratricopeptide (TPR) repeat protein
MAAAALRGLTLAELVAEVTAGLDVLTTNQPNIPARQRDMRHLLAASWRRLTPAEQTILAQLSLFRQPFNPDAAQAVTGARVGQMATIVAQAWLRRTSEGRYQTHGLLRHFAHEQLDNDPALAQEAQQRYTRYHLRWLAEWAEKPLTSSMLSALTACWVDMTLAWERGIHQQRWAELAEAVPTLRAFYEYKGLLGEGIGWLAMAEKQLNTAVSPLAQRVRALLLIEQAILCNLQVQSAPVPDLMAEAITLADRVGDGTLLLRAKIILVQGLARLGRLAETLALGLALLDQTDPAPTSSQQTDLQAVVGTTYLDVGELAWAEQYLRQATTYYEQEKNIARAASVRHNLAVTLIQRRAYAEARRLFIQNALFYRQHPSPSYKAMTYEGLGDVWMKLGRIKLAARYLEQARRLYEQLGDEDGLAYVALHQGKIALARGEWRHAEQMFLKSAELRHKMNLPHMLSQLWAGAALAAYRGGNTAVAQIYFDKLLPTVLAGEVAGDEIAWVYKVAAELAQEMGHPQAEEILAVGERQ